MASTARGKRVWILTPDEARTILLALAHTAATNARGGLALRCQQIRLDVLEEDRRA